MDFFCVLNVYRIFQLCAIVYLNLRIVQAVNPCGAPAVENCLTNCYTSCLKLDTNRAGRTEEQIATLKNLCDSKCYGIIYNPSRELWDGSFLQTEYSDVSQCLGLCAHPSPSFCQEGYLSQYFYCACHSCCLQNPSTQAQASCAEACHLWFMKQWSPKRGESCRYRPSYSRSQNDWCSAFCSWQQIIRMQPSTTSSSNISNLIANPPPTCLRKCASLLSANIPVDYDTTPACTSPLNCITFHIQKFLILTDIDRLNIQSFLREVPIGGGPYYYYNDEGRPKFRPWVFNQTWRHSMQNSIPEALINTRNMGINITFEQGRNILKFNVTPVISYAAPREERIIEELLRKSYKLQRTPGPEETFIFEQSPINMTITVAECMEFNLTFGRNEIHEMPLEYEAHIKVSDPTGGLPFLGYDMKTLVAQTPQFAGLQVVEEVDDSTLEMKWRGTMILSYVSLRFQYNSGGCWPIAGCTFVRSGTHCGSHQHYSGDPSWWYYGETY